jgi:protein arginine kinase
MTGAIHTMIQSVLKLGLTARGIYGEHSEAVGNMFQISNQKTLGQTEESIVNNVNNIAMQIIAQENNIRQKMLRQNQYILEDKVRRAFGILKEARLMSSDESFKWLSDLRLGIDMGIIKEVNREQWSRLFLSVQPGSLQTLLGKSIHPNERDFFRADVIRHIFTEEHK